VYAVCKLAHGPQRVCPAHTRTRSPEAETALAMPWWVLGWDVGCWLGHRRFARHWSVGQLRAAWADTDQMHLSDEASARSIRRYQPRLAARPRNPHLLAAAYADVDAVILALDGLQPEQGHATLSVVRALECQRVWCAAALRSSAAVAVQQLLARHGAARLGTPVRRWLSDTHEACVRGSAAAFPGVSHRECTKHCLRDVAEPVLDADSRAKVQRRRKVRGWRMIAREV